MQRGSGILLAISSLPGQYGIGTMGKQAYVFVDKLKKAGQKYWQVLPITPTGYGNSPYQSVSSYAGNPYYIDFEQLYRAGFLSKAELAICDEAFAASGDQSDYELQNEKKFELLRMAYERGKKKHYEEFIDFKERNAHWILDYSMFMAIKAGEGMRPFWDWPEDVRKRKPAVILGVAKELAGEIEFYQFVQFLFYTQWMKLKRYANERGVSIIGDIPIYVSPDSAEAWATPEIFDKEGNVAGCPPDYFSEDGQLWGNPLYDWEYLKNTSYDWWVRRVEFNLKNYDYLRIDHFRGFEAYYSIPKDAKSAASGEWVKGPGLDLFNTLKYRLGELPIIAEDLGFLTPEFFDFMQRCGFPGLKVLHFAFEPGSIYLPHKIGRECVIYTGTHDNDTTVGWFKTLPKEQKSFLTDYIGNVTAKNVAHALIRTAMASVADVCIIPMQDVLSLDSRARMNTPSTLGDNWTWRMSADAFDASVASWLKKQSVTYGRA